MKCHLCGSFASPVFEEYQAHLRTHEPKPWGLGHVRVSNHHKISLKQKQTIVEKVERLCVTHLIGGPF